MHYGKKCSLHLRYSNLMKHLISPLLILITILNLLSCNTNSKSADKNVLSNDTIHKVVLDSTLYNAQILIGEWGIFGTSSNSGGISAACNVCPNINFKNNHTAVIIKPSGQKKNLKWKINENTITLISIGKIVPEQTFSDTTYNITFTYKKDFIELELTPKRNKFSYILRH